MIDLIRCRGRGSRFAALSVAAMTLFALALVGTPASAVPPAAAENFSPDEVPNDATGDDENMVMSDRPDGTNSTFHVNTVATAIDTTHVEWYSCPPTYAAAGDPTLAVNGCDAAGSDSSGEGLTGAPGEVYENDYNVPYDGIRDWVAWVCSIQPYTTANCFEEIEEDVQFENAEPGPPASQASAGELTSPPNPSLVSNEGFAVTATTSSDVTEVTFCVDEADATTDPGGSCDDSDTEGTPDSTTATSKTWSGFLDPDDSDENAVMLFETGGGAPDGFPATNTCAGSSEDCLLDSHYVVSTLETPTRIDVTSEDATADTSKDECDETGHPTSATLPSYGGNFHVTGCIFDQSDNLITDLVHYAWQLTPDDPAAPVGGTDSLGLDDGHDSDDNDPDADEFFEQMDGDPGDADDDGGGTDLAFDGFDLLTLGNYVLTFCLDSDNNAADGPGQSLTPCAGETLSVNFPIEIVAPIDHVHVKKQGTEGPLCHTGSSSTTAPAGSAVNLVGCALGTAGGIEQGSAGNHVLWFVNPAGNPADPGQIVSQENTTDASGKADAVISSGAGAADKTSTIRFCLDEFPDPAGEGLGNGICDAGETGPGLPDAALQSDFQISWTQPGAPPPPPACNKIRGNSENNLLIGTADCDKIFARGGDDTSRGKAGDDVLNGGRGFDKGRGGPGNDRCPRTEDKKSC